MAVLATDPSGDYELYESQEVVPSDYHVFDVHSIIIGWFKSGFFSLLFFPFILTALGIITFFCNTIISMLSCVILGGSSVGIVIIWWLYGIALRFSLKGYYTFGDVVPEDMTKEEWKTELKEDEDSLYQY